MFLSLLAGLCFAAAPFLAALRFTATFLASAEASSWFTESLVTPGREIAGLINEFLSKVPPIVWDTETQWLGLFGSILIGKMILGAKAFLVEDAPFALV